MGAHRLELTPFVPGMIAVPPVPPRDYEGAQSSNIAVVQPGDNKGAQCSENESVLARDVYIHSPLPRVQFFNLDAHGKNRKCDQDYIQNLLTDEGICTGLFTISGVF